MIVYFLEYSTLLLSYQSRQGTDTTTFPCRHLRDRDSSRSIPFPPVYNLLGNNAI